MLVILLLTLVVSVVVGLAIGGKIASLADLRMTGTAFLYVALVIGLAPLLFRLPPFASHATVVIAYGLVAVFLLSNLLRTSSQIQASIGILLIGWSANAIVMAANGAMPLSTWAYRISGQTEAPTPGEGGFFKIELANDSTKLKFLGDVIPLAPIHQVVSIGDIILMVGVGFVVVTTMGSSIRRPSSERKTRRSL